VCPTRVLTIAIYHVCAAILVGNGDGSSVEPRSTSWVVCPGDVAPVAPGVRYLCGRRYCDAVSGLL